MSAHNTPFFRLLALSCFFVMISVCGYAQPGGGGHGCPKPPCPKTPISGIEYLIGLGGIYGLKKLMSKPKSGK